MPVVDASVWVALFHETDGHHRATRGWLARQLESGEMLITPSLALVEVAGAISRLAGDSDLAEAAVEQMLRIPNQRVLPMGRHTLRAAISLAASRRIRGADAVYIALAQRLGAPLVTWDRQQLERGSLFVRTLTPSDAITER